MFEKLRNHITKFDNKEYKNFLKKNKFLKKIQIFLSFQKKRCLDL